MILRSNFLEWCYDSDGKALEALNSIPSSDKNNFFEICTEVGIRLHFNMEIK
jgi:hypothetical protein